MKNIRLVILFSVLLCVALLASCGGGGSGGASVSEAPVAITAGNAERATGASAATTQSAFEASDMGGGLAIGAVARVGRHDFRIVPFARKQLRWTGADAFSAQVYLSALTVKTDLPCDNTGTASIVVNDVDNNGAISSGDSFTITFDNCLDSLDQTTTSGSMTMVVNGINGNPDTDLVWNAAITVTMRDLTISDGNSNDAISGDFTLNMSTNDGGVNTTGGIGGNSLSVTENGVTETLSNYSISFRSNDVTGAYTIDSSGTVSSSELEGAVQFATLTTFEGIDPDYPHTGVMKVSGAGDSSVTLTVIDNATVQLDVDEDGDGNMDQSIKTQWTVLDS